MQTTRLGIQEGWRESAQVVLLSGDLPTRLPGRDQLCVLFDERIGSPGILVSHIAGNCKDVAILLEREARRDACTRVLGGRNDQHPERHTAENTIANWEVLKFRPLINLKPEMPIKWPNN